MKGFSAGIPCLLALLLFAGTASSQELVLTADQKLIDEGNINAYAKKNIPSFTVSTLENGIPVILKRNESNRILALKTVLLGKASLVALEKAGLESVMLTMLTKGSESYSYDEVQRILYEKSANISPSFTSFDMSSFDLFTLDSYFDQVFDAYADAFLHPSWNRQEFPKVMDDFRIAKQEAQSDPYRKSVYDVNQAFFAGHPYLASWDGTESSLGNIDLEDVERYYERTVLSGRLFIVAVGNFNPITLMAKLNATFGALPRKPFTSPAVPAFKEKVKADLLVEKFPQSAGLAYVRGDFALPAPDSADFPALQVAFTLLDDILFEIVRTQNGACYGVWSSIHAFAACYGDITVFKTPVPGKVKRLIDDSIAVLLRGECLSGKVSASAEGKSGIGQAPPAQEQKGAFVPIAEALPFYSRQFLTAFYSGQETNASVAAQIAASVVYNGDYRDYLLEVDRISAVAPQDVTRVVKDYLFDNPTIWIALGDEEVLKGVNRDDYLRFLGN
jgi:zinc protease